MRLETEFKIKTEMASGFKIMLLQHYFYLIGSFGDAAQLTRRSVLDPVRQAICSKMEGFLQPVVHHVFRNQLGRCSLLNVGLLEFQNGRRELCALRRADGLCQRFAMRR